MKKSILRKIVVALTCLFWISSYAQPCSPSVPSYSINLTGFPAGVWSSPNVSRNSQCCGVQAPDQCIYFYLTLDPNAAGIQIDMIGADPAGSLFYQIGCTGNYPGGTIKCINGVGPHQITFCKPGSNKNIYRITSISRPLFPKDDTVRLGCKHKLVSYGVVNNSVTWNSIFPGAPGQYNNYLDSTNVASPTYSPGTGAPAYVDYQVCGYPQASGCGYSLTVCDTVRIYNFPKLTGTVTPNPATFCNNGPGSGVTLTASATGGQPTYTYTWKNTNSITVGTGVNYFASAAGVYYLEVKDKLYDPLECPAAYTAVSVSQGTIPTVDAGLSQKKCYNNPVATLNGSVQFANGGIWTGGAGTFSPGNTYLNTAYSPAPSELAAGFVKLYLTTTGAGGGCVNKTDSIKIYYPPLLTASIPSASIACFNGTTVLSSNVNGGTAPYARLWNTGSTNVSINAGQGNFSLIVTDSLGCTAGANINLVSPTALNINFNVSNVTVNGGNDGSATITPSGGNPAYTVTWTPGGSNNFSINNLVYGVYTATVTDANGCQRAGSTIVNEPRCLAFTAVSSGTNVNCNGANNGVASVTVSGGTPAYTYSWNSVPSQTTAVASGLNAGVYTCIIQDANNCFQTSNVTITEPSLLTDVLTHTNVSIIGGNNGAAAANPFGGTIPYTYLWSNGPTTSSVSGLVAGTYSVTITDNKGCTKNDNVIITQPPCNGLTINVYKNDVSCYGGTNGSAIAVVTGAGGSYTVNWSNGNTGPSVSNLAAGNYSVIVTNTNNCSEYVNFTITQPSQLSFGMLATGVSCFGNGNGSIDLTLSGGTYPYSYSWSNGSNAEDQVNLGPGTYSVQINDANGCSVVGSAGITQPSSLSVNYTVQNVSCIYGNNGAIGLNVNGGTFPFTYTWSNGATTQSISNLTAGGYSVLVKDANNCTIAQPLFISLLQPDSVKVDSFIVACSVPGTNSTQVTVIPQGGNPGSYQVSFNNGFSYGAPGVYTALLGNGATYSVVLKDVDNCTSLVPDLLNILTEVKIDSISFGKCYSPGTNSTIVNVYPSGGDNGPYAVSFDNGATYLAAGIYTASLPIASNYTAIVKDARGCVSAAQVINLPSAFSATANITSNFNGQNISCFGMNNGAAMATANGGSGSYTYTWTTVPQQTTAAASNLLAGTYTLIVKDGNNCTFTTALTLTQPALLTSTAIVTSNFNGQNISCFGLADGSASVSANGGTSPYNFNWNTVPSQTTAASASLTAGIYSVIVTDINNCASTSTVLLTQPASITSTATVISNYNGQQITCFGATDASASVVAANGTGAFTYSWSTVPVQTGTLANNLGAGTYSVLITDANGCNITNTISVSQPSQLLSTATVVSNYNGQNISCFGMSDASVSVSALGGTSPYTYTWNTVPVQNSSVATNVGAGTYTANVLDVNGCASTATLSVTQPLALTATLASLSDYNNFNVSCFGSTNGYIDITSSGGTGAYTYSWSNGAVTQDVNNIGAGSYSVLVTDVNNCTSTLSANLVQPPALVITIDSLSHYNGYNTRCHGSNDGAIYITVNGGVPVYQSVWSNGYVGLTQINIGAGNYSLNVMDMNNCYAQLDTALVQPPALQFNQISSQPLCNGASNGSINVTTGGGVSPFTYIWSNGATTEDLNNITGGTYTVVYADLNNCKDSSVIMLAQPDPIGLTKAVSGLKCYGDSIGSINLNVTGGTSPYNYLWSNGSSTKNQSQLRKGTYSVIITDVNGCLKNDTTVLSQPDSLRLALYSPLQFDGHNISYAGGSDGVVTMTVNGGVTPYTYYWSNTESSQNLYNVVAGTYSIVVVDNNGCKINGGITLTEPFVLEMPTGFSPNNDGKNDFFVVHGIEAFPQNQITIYNRWGNIVYHKSGYANEWMGNSNNGMICPDATYFVILEINAGEKVLKGYVELRR